MTLGAQKVRPATNKWDLIKLNSFHTAKETMKQIKGSPQNGRISLPAMYLKKLGTDLPCDPVMPLLGMHPKNFIAYYRNACTSMFTVILSTITGKWNKIDVYQLMDV